MLKQTLTRVRHRGAAWIVGVGSVVVLAASLALVAGESEGRITGTAVGVTDGDTITVLVAKREVRVRIEGVDCPERAQPFGRVAKAFTSSRRPSPVRSADFAIRWTCGGSEVSISRRFAIATWVS